jgi:hypothetical protein
VRGERERLVAEGELRGREAVWLEEGDGEGDGESEAVREKTSESAIIEVTFSVNEKFRCVKRRRGVTSRLGGR